MSKQGWLQLIVDEAVEEVKKWPEWMKAQLDAAKTEVAAEMTSSRATNPMVQKNFDIEDPEFHEAAEEGDFDYLWNYVRYAHREGRRSFAEEAVKKIADIIKATDWNGTTLSPRSILVSVQIKIEKLIEQKPLRTDRT